MGEYLIFKTRQDFREWLSQYCLISEGVWLYFDKSSVQTTLKASEALEEALCFGWIDGQMKSIDNNGYIKYFSIRKKIVNGLIKINHLLKFLRLKG